MSHYFDDVLHRGNTGHNGSQTPKTPSMLSPTAPRLLRRSSTSRSLAARSDYSVNDKNGYDTHDGSENGDGADTPGGYSARRGSVNPAQLNDPAKVKEREEADAHLHSYITQQLERVKLERGADVVYEEGDEFEAQP
jgi:hypothetical protein